MQYRKEIDGLRALAVVPVILFHAGFVNFGGGFVGVDIFFVISGYLITAIILNDMSKNSFKLIDFYERRARRILPALFFVVLCSLPFAWFLMLPQDFKNYSESLVAVATFSSNILFWITSGYFEAASELKPLLHTWSLAVEEQYYLLFPLILMLMWSKGLSRIIGIALLASIFSFTLAQWSALTYQSFAFYSLPTRAFELLIGALISLIQRHVGHKKLDVQPSNHLINQLFSFFGLLLILFSIFAFDKGTHSPSFYTLVPLIGAALIIIFGISTTIVGRLLGSKIFSGIGLISYSSYLWHQPIFAFYKLSIINQISILELILLSMSSFLLGYLSWKFIEIPFRKNSISTKVFLSSAIVISLILIIIGFSGYLMKGFPLRNMAVTEILSEDMGTFQRSVKSCWQKFEKTPAISSGCKIGEEGENISFSLFGDSHAGIFIHSLDAIAKNKSITGINYSYKSCPPLIGVYPRHDNSNEALTCSSLKNSFFDGLGDLNDVPKIVIISARWSNYIRARGFDNEEGGIDGDINRLNYYYDLDTLDYQRSVAEKITHSIKNIVKSGRKVILIYPIPEMGWNVPSRLANIIKKNNFLLASDGSVSYDTYLNDNKIAIESLDNVGLSNNIVRIRPDLIFCNTILKNRCVAHIGGKPIYYDSNHLSDFGASIIASDILKHIKLQKTEF
jgi:peptidoglycan/LPS O-acetylase OafA/YrhL